MSYQAIAERLPGVGGKRVCVSCATRFYDLARTPPVCPKCGAEQPPDVPRAPLVRRAPTRHRMVKAASITREPDEDAAPVLDPDEEAEEDDDAETDAVEDEDEVDAAEDPKADDHER